MPLCTFKFNSTSTSCNCLLARVCSGPIFLYWQVNGYYTVTRINLPHWAPQSYCLQRRLCSYRPRQGKWSTLVTRVHKLCTLGSTVGLQTKEEAGQSQLEEFDRAWADIGQLVSFVAKPAWVCLLCMCIQSRTTQRFCIMWVTSSVLGFKFEGKQVF